MFCCTVQGIVEIMEDFETLNDTVNSIETRVDEIGTKVDNNTEALQEVNNTVTTKSAELESKIHSFDEILSEAAVHINTLNYSLNTTNVNLQNSIDRIDTLNSTTSMYS
jgi:chromosome segregation ATPase